MAEVEIGSGKGRMLDLLRREGYDARGVEVNAAMIDGLDRALSRAEADAEVRVVVLAGAGRAFSAGFDLDMEAGDGSPDSFRIRISANADGTGVVYDNNANTPLGGGQVVIHRKR